MKALIKVGLLLCFLQTYAQVGINTTDPEAQLDIKSSNQATPTNKDGILIPKVDAFPASNPTASQQGMLVYLTTTSGTNEPGFYYWDNTTTSWIGIVSTASGDKDWYKANTTTTPSNTDDMYHMGNIGIGNSNPTVPLQFGWSTGDKISFFGDAAVHHGIGVQDYLLQIHGGLVSDDIAFGYGTSAAFTENMRIKGNGNVGIGLSNPGVPLQFKFALGDKISLYGGAGDHYGFGIQHQLLQIHADLLNSDIAFGYGHSASFTERMRIKGTGNVGIGLTNPLSKLHVKSGVSGLTPNATAVASIESADGTYFNLLSAAESGVLFGANGNATNGGIIYNPTSLPDGMHFRTNNNSTKMVISSAGNVGIGTIVPSSKLHVQNGSSTITANGSSLLTVEGSSTNVYTNLLSTQETGVLFGASGTSNNGGIIYNPSAFTSNSMIFRTGGNANRVVIGPTGKVGIGSFNPTVPLEFDNVVGEKICLYGTTSNMYGFGIQSSLLQMFTPSSAQDIAFGNGTTDALVERMRIKGTGNVGIGTSNPSSRLHIQNGSSGITANGSSLLTVEGSGTNVYTNLLSTQETGVLFGASGSSANGGVIYNSSSYPNSMMFRTGGNTNRMVIGSTGNVAIGNFSANYPLQFAATLGDKICLYDSGATNYGLGVQGNLLQIHSDLNGSDIAFGHGTSASFTENVRIKGTGEVGIGTAAPTAALEVNGYTKLGTTAPAVKLIKLTGTTAASQGTSITLATGVTGSKILAVNILVDYVSGSSVPPSYTASIGYEYDYYLNGSNLIIINKTSNSANILSKPIKVLITYEE